MKELIILIILIILFGVGSASPPNMKREGYYLPSEGGAIPPVGPPWHLLYEHPDPYITYKSISIEDWPEEFCEQQG